jgi:hypothetical protein
MRGSIVVLALAVTPLVARVSQAQHRPHWQRHDMPSASRRDDDRKGDDKKCEDRKRGNPSQNGLDHRADPKSKGNKDCDTQVPPTQPPPPPPPPVTPPPADQFGHTQIEGSVFFDVDNDGFFGTDEVGISGWTVQVSGPMSASAQTGANGYYIITGLTPGDYVVCVMPPMGWAQTSPSLGAGTTGCANATIGVQITAPAVVGDVGYSGVDFGFVSTSG